MKTAKKKKISKKDMIIIRMAVLYGRCAPDSQHRGELTKVAVYLAKQYDAKTLGDTIDLITSEYGFPIINPEKYVPL